MSMAKRNAHLNMTRTKKNKGEKGVRVVFMTMNVKIFSRMWLIPTTNQKDAQLKNA